MSREWILLSSEANRTEVLRKEMQDNHFCQDVSFSSPFKSSRRRSQSFPKINCGPEERKSLFTGRSFALLFPPLLIRPELLAHLWQIKTMKIRSNSIQKKKKKKHFRKLVCEQHWTLTSVMFLYTVYIQYILHKGCASRLCSYILKNTLAKKRVGGKEKSMTCSNNSTLSTENPSKETWDFRPHWLTWQRCWQGGYRIRCIIQKGCLISFIAVYFSCLSSEEEWGWSEESPASGPRRLCAADKLDGTNSMSMRFLSFDFFLLREESTLKVKFSIPEHLWKTQYHSRI